MGRVDVLLWIRTDRSTTWSDDPAAQPPYAFAIHLQAGAGMVMHTSPSHCIGTACMGWRWWAHQPSEEYADRETGKPVEAKRKGYCGKAGVPQR